MANVPSAEKRNRQRLRRRARNLFHLTRVRTSVKKVLASIDAKDGKATSLLEDAVRLIDVAARKGVIKRETASRKISRLTRRVQAAQASK